MAVNVIPEEARFLGRRRDNLRARVMCFTSQTELDKRKRYCGNEIFIAFERHLFDAGLRSDSRHTHFDADFINSMTRIPSALPSQLLFGATHGLPEGVLYIDINYRMTFGAIAERIYDELIRLDSSYASQVPSLSVWILYPDFSDFGNGNFNMWYMKSFPPDATPDDDAGYDVGHEYIELLVYFRR